jgi:hypothetical protein
MIPKEISHTSVQNPTHDSIQENISSIQNYQGLSFLPVTLLVWQICFLSWDLGMDSFVETLCICFDGPVARYLLVMQEGQSSNPGFYVYFFFMITSLIPFGIT